ncbi:MAG: c-type cytochrome [Gammaproteobacteria bacterium]|nr:c-type cytochrome [Gammaproteobacteria bacterium]MDH4255960.1 c-type cytochrome [Gammaproteobacteria bacterium]MDH5311645.1 c-type cytochrome [Gammaproteobacteria bacterium]
MSEYATAWKLPAGLFALLTFAAAVYGEPDGAALVAEKRCVACHDETEVLLGPPYRAIAARHAAQADVMVEVLARKIILGGAGNWGVVPMVPNEHVSEDEARAMARWILALD